MRNVKSLNLVWLVEKLKERNIPLDSPKAEYMKQMYLKAIN